jgi:hypothetical protein
VTEVFDAWAAAHIDRLRGIAIGDHPKALIADPVRRSAGTASSPCR